MKVQELVPNACMSTAGGRVWLHAHDIHRAVMALAYRALALLSHPYWRTLRYCRERAVLYVRLHVHLASDLHYCMHSC